MSDHDHDHDDHDGHDHGHDHDGPGRPNDGLDGSFVPVPRPDAVLFPMDGGALLLGTEEGSVDVLDPLASVVWQCLDGEVDLGTLADELAEEFSADRDQVLDDILGMTRLLGSRGLLVGLSTPVPAMPEPTGYEVGEALAPLDLEDLDGAPAGVGGPGRQLLVNWSPGCGFCLKIIPELASRVDALAAQGIDLLLLASGEAERNRDALGDAALRVALKPPASPAVFDEDGVLLVPATPDPSFVDPFVGLGTPAAYLLEPGGVVAAPLAYGAIAVPELLKTIAGGAVEPRPGAKYLPGSPEGGACGPGGSSSRTERSWQPTQVFQAGVYTVGIRTDSEAADELLRSLLAPSACEPDPYAPPTFSLVLPGLTPGKKDLNFLQATGSTVVRSRSPRRVLGGLLARLSGLATYGDERTLQPGLLRLRASAVIGPEGAILVPGLADKRLEQLQPRFARLGLRPVDDATVVVDLATAELVLDTPTIPHDAGVLASVPSEVVSRAELEPADPGRYPLVAWALYGAGDLPGSPAAVAGALAAVVVEPADLPAAAAAVAELLARVPVAWADRAKAEDLAECLKQVVAS